MKRAVKKTIQHWEKNASILKKHEEEVVYNKYIGYQYIYWIGKDIFYYPLFPFFRRKIIGNKIDEICFGGKYCSLCWYTNLFDIGEFDYDLCKKHCPLAVIDKPCSDFGSLWNKFNGARGYKEANDLLSAIKKIKI